ncbi:MAG: FtsK/SpoIIIE domain-containing protein [Streptosporangiaceae bacterium]
MSDPQSFSRADLHKVVVPIRKDQPLDDEVLELAEVEDPPGSDVQLYEEVIEGVLVDDPNAAAGGWMADRRAHLAEAPAVIAPYLRNRADLAAASKFVIRYYTHRATFHGVRVPLYWGRLATQSPRGVARLSRRWGRWVTDAEARPVVAHVAGGKDGDAWTRVANLQSQRTGKRWKKTGYVGVPAALLITLAAVFLPGWQLAVVGVVVASLLGLAGGNADRPVVKRYVSVHLQRALDSPEVQAAIEAIGIKGAIRFVSPIQTDGPGWRAELDLPGAYEADEVMEKRSALAAAMRRPLSTVWPEPDRDAHPGRLVLWVAREDPAKAKRRLWPLLYSGQADLFDPIPFGFDPRGRLVTVPLMSANMLIGGIMGSGKTSAILTIALTGALDPAAELWIYELKGSGDLDAIKPVCHRYVSGDDDEDCKAALDSLKALEREMKRRKALIKDMDRKHFPNGRKVSKELAAMRDLGLHPLLAVYDECHTLFESEYGKEAAEVAGRLIRKARAYGILLVFTTQRPDAKSIPRVITDNALIRFCLAVTGHIPNDLIMGTGAYKRGIRATIFNPQTEPGAGQLGTGGLGAQVARAAFIKQEEAYDIAARALALRTAQGTLTGEAAGEVIVDVEESNIVDQVLVIWEDGAEAMHSHRLIELLAERWPTVYGNLLTMEKAAASTAISGMLKAAKISTKAVNIRGCCGSARGIHASDLPAAYEPEDDEEDV